MLTSMKSASLIGALVLSALTGAAQACPGDLNGDGLVDAADIASLLANWGTGTGDIDGDGVVDGADLGFLLGSWGACAPACSGYQQMFYQGTFVGGAGSPFPPIVINADVNVLPSGEPQGSLIFVSNGSLIFGTIAQGATALNFDDGSVIFPAAAPVEIVLIDGLPYLLSEVLDQFGFDVMSGLSSTFWPISSRAILLLAALVETQPYCCNLQASLDEGTPSSFAYWARLGTASLGGAVMIRGVDGCDDIDGCSANGLTPIGKFQMPCQSLDPLCKNDTFAGGQATYNAVLGLWEGQ